MPSPDEPRREEPHRNNNPLEDLIKSSSESAKPIDPDRDVADRLRHLEAGTSSFLHPLDGQDGPRVTLTAQAALRQLERLSAPSTQSSHLRWQCLYAIIQETDPALALPMAPKAREMLRLALESFDQEWKQKVAGRPTPADFEQRFQNVYRYVRLQATADGLRACSEHFSRIEKEMAELPGGSLERYVAAQLRETKAYERTRQADLNKEMVTALAVNEAASGRHPLKKNFTLENGVYVYTHAGKDGRQTHWRFEPYSDDAACLRCVENPDAISRLPRDSLFEALEKKDTLDQVIQAGLSNLAAEERRENVERLESFDLPPGNAVHLRLFPTDGDKIVTSMLHGSAALSAALRQRYRGRLEIRPPLFCTDAKTELTAEIARAYQGGKGAKIFCIDIYSHGDPNGLEIGEGLNGADLLDIARKFPDCTFILNTDACFGGGVRNAVLPSLAKPGNEDLRRRMAIFLQTKPDATAFSSLHPAPGGAPRLGASNYRLHFIQALYHGKTYGQAAREADRETKRYTPLDAEAVIDGHLITRTAPKGADHA